MEEPFTILFQSEEDMDLHNRLVNAYGVQRRFCKPGRLDGDAARGHGDPGCCYEKEKSTMKYCMNVFEGIEKKKLYPLLRTQGFEGTFNNPEIGYCYDSGHEAYLTPGERFLPKLGHRLFCTHLNDNDGKKDMHWLPFDGVGDFYRTCQELKDCGYKGNLTLEVACRERYKAIYSDEEYIAKCYEAAEKIHSLVYG